MGSGAAVEKTQTVRPAVVAGITATVTPSPMARLVEAERALTAASQLEAKRSTTPFWGLPAATAATGALAGVLAVSLHLGSGGNGPYGGGGGGFSGGDAGFGIYGGGDGGSSFLDGSVTELVSTAGENSGNGYVTIGSMSPSVAEPSVWAMMLVGFAGLGFAGYRASRKSVA